MNFDEIQKANDAIKTTDIKGKDYAEVNQRIKAFRMLHPEGCIHTEIISNENGVCIIKATVSNAEGKELGTGLAYEKEGSTFINKTSYIENCETSAVGRALGMCGIGIDVSVASYEEVANAVAQQAKQETNEAEIANQKIPDIKVKALLKRCKDDNVSTAKILQLYKVKSLSDLTERMYLNIHEHWDKIKG